MAGPVIIVVSAMAVFTFGTALVGYVMFSVIASLFQKATHRKE